MGELDPAERPSVAEALSPAWNGKFLINAESRRLDSGNPDRTTMNEVHDKYDALLRADVGFAQMGATWWVAATTGRAGIEGDITKESVNAAFKNLKNFDSDLWCKPLVLQQHGRQERL